MYQLAHVVNAVLYRAREEEVPMTQMKLQKMVYFLYGEYLLTTGEPLFGERFEMWRYGPVISDIYQAFKRYGARPIKGYMSDVNGEYRRLLVEDDLDLLNCFSRIWQRYKGKSGIELSNLTHQARSAWYAAYQRNDCFLNDDDIKREMSERANGN